MVRSLAVEDGGVVFRRADGGAVALHPVWLRERSREPAEFDAGCRQRLYDPWRIEPSIRVEGVIALGPDAAEVRFSDGSGARYRLDWLERELDPAADPGALPPRTPWTAAGYRPNTATLQALDGPAGLSAFLDGFLRDGHGLIHGCGTEPGTVLRVAERFGPVRVTNFGVLFEVRVTAAPTDLAYTALPLYAHTDNPYRRPIPGIQFLSCLCNDADGGDSTLVDGLAVAESVRADDPAAFAALTSTDIRYRYDGDGSVLEDVGRMVEVDEAGAVRRIRFNPRVEYVLPAPPDRLAAFYRARARFGARLGDPAFEVRQHLQPGDTLMLDNHRLAHGRTGFAAAGPRHLQGCYIEHDGPESRYRVSRGAVPGAHPVRGVAEPVTLYPLE